MKNKLLRIRGGRVQDWLSLNGVEPVKWWGDIAYYEKNKRVLDLLNTYSIRNYYFKNKL